jgi:glyoxylase-like metal-dependent hydrolase (beta-lactamase superfamily II)
MTMRHQIGRRTFLGGGAACVAAPLLAGMPGAAAAAPSFHRLRLGDLVLTAIHDGVWHRPIDASFVRNVPFAAVRQAMAEASMPGDNLPTPFTALLMESGGRRVLIDTGTGGQIAPTANALADNLAAAAIDARTIDLVLISHFHPDHINGLKTKDNARVFPNAEIRLPAAEWAFWMDDANLRAAPQAMRLYFLNARRVLADLAADIVQFTEGEVAHGVTAIAAHGHTPGHTVFAIASGRESLLVLGDTSNHPALFVRHPDWQPVIDMDGPRAAATRRRLLDRAASDRMLVHGYHFPFPACGSIVRDGMGFAFVPSST